MPLQKAQEEKDQVTRGGILCCLGELLFRWGRLDEAESVLNQFERLEQHNDVLGQEARRVKELQGVIQKSKNNNPPL